MSTLVDHTGIDLSKSENPNQDWFKHVLELHKLAYMYNCETIETRVKSHIPIEYITVDVKLDL